MGKSVERTQELYAAFKADEVTWEPPPDGVAADEAIRQGTWFYDGETFSIFAKDDVFLIFDDGERDAFLDGVRHGEFDLPTNAG